MPKGKDETWRIRNEKRYAPAREKQFFRPRRKSDAQKIVERDERDALVEKMKRRMK